MFGSLGLFNARLSPQTYDRDGDPRRYDDGVLDLTLHCHYLNDFCIKLSSDEGHFNVLLIVKGKVDCPQITILEEKGELKWGIKLMLSAYQPNTLLPGQTG